MAWRPAPLLFLAASCGGIASGRACGCRRNSPTQRIVGIEPQARLSGDVGRADDRRLDMPARLVEPAIVRGKRAANDAFLNPFLAGGEGAVGCEARKLGT